MTSRTFLEFFADGGFERMETVTVVEQAKARAERARAEMAEAVHDFVSATGGATNAEVARALGLESESLGGQQNHLTHSILADLTRAGRLARVKRENRLLYIATH